MHNKETIVDSLNELETKINKFKEDIENIKNLYDKLFKNLNSNYKILRKIVNAYDDNDYKKKTIK